MIYCGYFNMACLNLFHFNKKKTCFIFSSQTNLLLTWFLFPVQEKEKKSTANMGFDYAPTYRNYF